MCATAAVLVPDACTANTYNLWQRVMKRGGKIGEKEKEETRSGRKTERERETEGGGGRDTEKTIVIL